ncbi:MAG: hypothetical protein IPN76_33140, partial [Saprospiraceae bacterium]|nr:hypothetical protein [Saprospiraceae bacterium]
MKKSLILLPFLLNCLVHIAAQNLTKSPAFTCQSNAAMAAFKGLNTLQLQIEEQLRIATQDYEKSLLNLPFTLPVVVHIIHQNGAENISNQRVYEAINHLNDAFAHTGYYGQQGAGTNVQIQFCLAKQTPSGEPTNGIERVESSLTDMVMETDDLSLKDLSRWTPYGYINVWVVNSISSQSSGPGVAGYAYLASAHGAAFDGIVCEASFFGVSEQSDAVLIHEMGHYLNLYHTFDNGCPNDDCLASGDRVCDTPPDQTTSSDCDINTCHTDTDDTSSNNPLTSDLNDPTENFMDYAPFSCYHTFSEGQALRMQMAVEKLRGSLLESKACKAPCQTPLSALFTVQTNVVDAGESILVDNQSMGATIFLWSLNGNLFSGAFEPQVNFPISGTYLLELTVLNNDENCEETYAINITARCDVDAFFSANNTLLKVGETFTATNTSVGADNYKWFVNDVMVSTTTDFSFSFSDPGYYTVRLEATSPHCSQSYQKGVTVGPELPCNDYMTAYCYGDFWNNSPFIIKTYPNGESIINWWTGIGEGAIGRIDKEGNYLWKIRSMGIQVSPYNLGILAQSDGAVLFNIKLGNSNDFNLCRINPNGEVDWVKKISTISNLASSLINIAQVGSDIVVTVSGIFNNHNTYIFCLDSLGNTKWKKVYYSPNSYFVHNIISSKDGNFSWLIGQSTDGYDKVIIMKVDNMGNIIFFKQYMHNNLGHLYSEAGMATEDGGLIVNCSETDLGQITTKNVLIKLDGEGNKVWAKSAQGLGQNNSALHPIYVLPKPLGGFLMNVQTGFGLSTTYSDWLSFTDNGEFEWRERLIPLSTMDTSATVQNVMVVGQKLLAAVRGTSNKRICLLELDSLGHLPDCPGKIEVPTQFSDFDLNSNALDYSATNGAMPISPGSWLPLSFIQPIKRSILCPIDAPCPEICGNQLDDDDDGYTDCFDEECECFQSEECTAEGEVPIEARLAWKSEGGLIASNANPIVANLNPKEDEVSEIIVADKASAKLLIYKGDGSNSEEPVSLDIPGGIGNVTPAIADIDADGVPELVVVCADHRIRVFTDYTATQLPPMVLWASSSTNSANPNHAPLLADFNEDGIPEIVLGNTIYRFNLSTTQPTLTLVLSGNGHAGQHSQGTAAPMPFDFLNPADCGGDVDCDGLELVAGAHVYSIDLNPFDGDGLEMKIQRDLSEMYFGNDFGDGHTFIADVDMDWTPDVVTVGSFSGNAGIYVWDKFHFKRFLQYPAPSSQFANVTIGNVYDDTKSGFYRDWPEIVATSADRITAYSFQSLQAAPYSEYWWSIATGSDGKAGCSCFDLNSDGIAEILLHDQNRFRLLYGSAIPFPAGVDNDRNWFTMTAPAVSLGGYPVVAELDNDGQTKSIFVTQSNNGVEISVVESNGNAWTPSRPIWNQYQYFGLNIEDNLTVPRHQQRHDLEFHDQYSYIRPFNLALSQIPRLNGDFEPYLTVPDAIVELQEVHCVNDSLMGTLKICNMGDASISDNMNIAV